MSNQHSQEFVREVKRTDSRYSNRSFDNISEEPSNSGFTVVYCEAGDEMFQVAVSKSGEYEITFFMNDDVHDYITVNSVDEAVEFVYTA